jgi:hypothetical protein
MSLRIVPLLAAFTFVAALAWPAAADVAPPNTSQCASSAEGDACTTDASKAGACVTQKCSKLDYSNGTPPSTITVDCLTCVETAAGSTSTGCSLAAGHAGTAGALLAALGLPLLVMRRRRR